MKNIKRGPDENAPVWVYDAGESTSLFISSDHHIDHPDCDRKLLKKHLDTALQRGAGILIFGDTLCAMQGPKDPRRSGGKTRKEDESPDYYDAILKSAQEFYRPYASNILLISEGNHETSVLKHSGTHLSKRLAESLGVIHAPYSGWMVLKLQQNTRRSSVTLRWHHGYGGGGEVTRGMIDNARTRSTAFADIFVSGHIHRRNVDENIVDVVTAHRLKKVRQYFFRCGSYKDETSHGSGFHVERGGGSRPLGGWLVHISTGKTNCGVENTITYESL